MTSRLRSVWSQRRAPMSLIAISATIVALAPGQAGAATQIGQTFNATENCGEDPITLLQSGSPGGQYAAPLSGVITSWSYQAGAVAPQQLKLKVGRAAGGDSFRIVGESAVQSPTANALNTYPTRVSVEAGDVIGFFIFGVDPPCGSAMPGYPFRFALGDPSPGTTMSYAAPAEDAQLDVSAILEADCDNDGFGDETQDPELPPGQACGKGNRTLTLDANKNKVKKRKKVTLSGGLSSAARQGPCEAGQTVELQRKRPKQTTFTTFAQVQTDVQGSFSLKKKVKKTFEFRAQVVETAACTAALSNSEKVKVKKKKDK
jgi:hypothetical protein